MYNIYCSIRQPINLSCLLHTYTTVTARQSILLHTHDKAHPYPVSHTRHTPQIQPIYLSCFTHTTHTTVTAHQYILLKHTTHTTATARQSILLHTHDSYRPPIYPALHTWHTRYLQPDNLSYFTHTTTQHTRQLQPIHIILLLTHYTHDSYNPSIYPASHTTCTTVTAHLPFFTHERYDPPTLLPTWQLQLTYPALHTR